MRIIFGGLTAIDALKESFGYFKAGSLTSALLVALVALLMSSVGILLCFVGMFFTTPLAICILVTTYVVLFGEQSNNADDQSIAVELNGEDNTSAEPIPDEKSE